MRDNSDASTEVFSDMFKLLPGNIPDVEVEAWLSPSIEEQDLTDVMYYVAFLWQLTIPKTSPSKRMLALLIWKPQKSRMKLFDTFKHKMMPRLQMFYCLKGGANRLH